MSSLKIRDRKVWRHPHAEGRRRPKPSSGGAAREVLAADGTRIKAVNDKTAIPPVFGAGQKGRA